MALKPVNRLAGIGPVLGGRLKEAGYGLVEDVIGWLVIYQKKFFSYVFFLSLSRSKILLAGRGRDDVL